IGAGPAGLAAGIYAGRANLKTAIIEKLGTGGQVMITDKIANYPGFPNEISGFDLGDALTQQAQKFGAQLVYDEIESVTCDGIYKVVNGKSDSYKAKALIIASGVRYKSIGIPGESQLRGRGVSYCATCDGPFFKDQPIVVIGGGDAAVEEGIYLTQFCSSVTIVHRRNEFRAAPSLVDHAKANPKIKFELEQVPVSIDGTNSVESITLKNVKDGSQKTIETKAVFIFIGYNANTEYLEGFVKMTPEGWIITDEEMKTDKPGVFAAGDLRVKSVRQVVTAVSDGAIAAQNAWKWLEENR
ncbi:MAG: thioredoxin-disulfide reductase, partial [Caldiserica bacterium]|nr:thioredoxin-disulfide reductase [Caldisericota bacterium]